MRIIVNSTETGLPSYSDTIFSSFALFFYFNTIYLRELNIFLR
jgi:hypothetical protein